MYASQIAQECRNGFSGPVQAVSNSTDWNHILELLQFFSYDDLNRLLSASSSLASSGSNYSHLYVYDAIGNITSSTPVGSYVYGGGAYTNPHAATTVASTSYSYDNNGNLTSDGTWTHSWDYRNRLSTSSSTTKLVNYAYDHANTRVQMKTSNTTSTVIASGNYSVENSTPIKYISANGVMLATVRGSGTSTASAYWMHPDHLGSQEKTTDDSGSLSELTDYYPFGNQRQNSGSLSDRKGYLSKDLDSDTGLSQLEARYYKAGVGRFVSQDPVFWSPEQFLSDPQQLNSYSYGRNNPIRFSDPRGLWINNGDGSFVAEKGDTLWGLQRDTGRNWKDTGFSRDPKTLQVNETVSFTPAQSFKNLYSPTINSTKEAVAHYYAGDGRNLNLGPNIQNALRNHREQQARESRIINREASLEKGNYGVDITDEFYFVGDTPVEYYTTQGVEYGVTTFSGFVRDGFWDIFPGKGDGNGPGKEAPWGVPYSFNPYVWSISYPKPKR